MSVCVCACVFKLYSVNCQPYCVDVCAYGLLRVCLGCEGQQHQLSLNTTDGLAPKVLPSLCSFIISLSIHRSSFHSSISLPIIHHPLSHISLSLHPSISPPWHPLHLSLTFVTSPLRLSIPPFVHPYEFVNLLILNLLSHSLHLGTPPSFHSFFHLVHPSICPPCPLNLSSLHPSWVPTHTWPL